MGKNDKIRQKIRQNQKKTRTSIKMQELAENGQQAMTKAGRKPAKTNKMAKTSIKMQKWAETGDGQKWA